MYKQNGQLDIIFLTRKNEKFRVRLLSSSFISALTWFWHQPKSASNWRNLLNVKIIIWIHLLSRQSFSRRLITWKRIISDLFRITSWSEKGWRDNRWMKIINFASCKSCQLLDVLGWCQNHINAKIKADESNLTVKQYGLFRCQSKLFEYIRLFKRVHWQLKILFLLLCPKSY